MNTTPRRGRSGKPAAERCSTKITVLVRPADADLAYQIAGEHPAGVSGYVRELLLADLHAKTIAA